MQFSDFGRKLTQHSGILQLMDDIGRPMPEGIKVYPLGGGNPAEVPSAQMAFRREMERILSSERDFENLISRYDAPQGRVSFLSAVASFFRKEYGWDITEKNIAVTNGSQSAMFYLFNLFSGKTNGRVKKILFPLMPEYIGYADQSIEPGTFCSVPAKCMYFDDNTMKYILDKDAVENYLQEHDDIGAICVSRPTNPSGNVLRDDEISFLSSLAHRYSIPLIIDNAYGVPFPDIIFTENARPLWNDDIILSMSLSKIGLPSVRTGIIIAREEIASAVGNMNAIIALASVSVGQVLAERLLSSGELTALASDCVRPFYQEKALRMEGYIRKYFDGTEYYFHRIEGSIFSWLYLPSLKIPTLEFYSVLMKKGVVTVPGEYFFFGGTSGDGRYPHEHYDKCLRLNYSSPDDIVQEGVRLIAEEYRNYS